MSTALCSNVHTSSAFQKLPVASLSFMLAVFNTVARFFIDFVSICFARRFMGSLLQKAKMFHSLLDNRLTSLDLVGFFSPGI